MLRDEECDAVREGTVEGHSHDALDGRAHCVEGNEHERLALVARSLCGGGKFDKDRNSLVLANLAHGRWVAHHGFGESGQRRMCESLFARAAHEPASILRCPEGMAVEARFPV